MAASMLLQDLWLQMKWLSRESVDCYGISRYAFANQDGGKENEPCMVRIITGRKPNPQAIWKIDFHHDGYKAFIRTIAGDIRHQQLNIYCDEKRPGQLFLALDIEGDAGMLRKITAGVSLQADPVSYSNADYYIEQIEKGYSHLTIKIQRRDILNFLTKTNMIYFTVSFKSKQPVARVPASLAGSRKALIFAANNCTNKGLNK